MFDERIIEDLFDKVQAAPSLNCNGRTIAAIVCKGYPIITGLNCCKSHPVQLQYSRRPKDSWMHAEVAAYVKARRIITVRDFQQADLYVIRKRSNPSTGSIEMCMARPCENGCDRMVRQVGFRNVFYSDQSGGIQLLRT